ncbi:GyrI-like domain-containing protein [Micromonospora sp. NPDC047670]|uniref:GyrI-like domain-containing protein n=1 Tax=Micromonospora sp. NPDC047670 TaxID=3364252 RepID=UPI0037106F5E
MAWYAPAGEADAEAVVVHAGVSVTAGPAAAVDFAVVDLPAVDAAATIVHRGPMDEVERSMAVLARWIEEHGYRADGFAREVYLDYCQDDPDNGVTELQLPVRLA